MTTQDELEDQAYEAWDAERYSDAFSLFLAAEAHGARIVRLNIGYCFDEGLGTPPSKYQALAWYRRAHVADRRSGSAASNIALVMRKRGAHGSAFRWFQKSAVRRDGDTCVDLAKCYLTGLGVTRSAPLGLTLLRRAIRSKHITPAAREEAQSLLRAQGVLLSLNYRRP